MSKSYRPSNGSEGECFQSQWCEKCVRDQAFRDDPDSGDGCPILGATMIFNIDDEEYPVEWIEDDKGEARCTAFEPMGSVRCDKTIDLFGSAA